MPLDVDLTAFWRQHGVLEYILLGEALTGSCGKLWQTFGIDTSNDAIHKHEIAPFVQDKYTRIFLDEVSRYEINVGDFNEYCGNSRCVVFRKDGIPNSHKVELKSDIGTFINASSTITQRTRIPPASTFLLSSPNNTNNGPTLPGSVRPSASKMSNDSNNNMAPLNHIPAPPLTSTTLSNPSAPQSASHSFKPFPSFPVTSPPPLFTSAPSLTTMHTTGQSFDFVPHYATIGHYNLFYTYQFYSMFANVHGPLPAPLRLQHVEPPPIQNSVQISHVTTSTVPITGTVTPPSTPAALAAPITPAIPPVVDHMINPTIIVNGTLIDSKPTVIAIDGNSSTKEKKKKHKKKK